MIEKTFFDYLIFRKGPKGEVIPPRKISKKMWYGDVSTQEMKRFLAQKKGKNVLCYTIISRTTKER